MDVPVKVQITDYDSYQAAPSPLDSLRNAVAQVPILRIYGSLVFSHNNTKFSHPVLVHIHNYFPYVYLNCDVTFAVRDEAAHLKDITAYLEWELRESFKRRNTEDDEVEDIDLHYKDHKRRFIASVTLCKGVPFYGFNVGYRLFYKISFLSPLYKSRFTNILQSNRLSTEKFSSRRKHRLQIYESHIPFTSQFLMDFNLFGCNWLTVQNCFFRYPIGLPDADSALKSFLAHHINAMNVLSPDSFERYGRSLVEIDVQASQILNRKHISQNNTHHGFGELQKNSISTDVDPQILLNSLNAIFKDLDYQSSTNHFDYTPQPKSSKLEGHRSTVWPNAPYLQELLAYAVKLNRPTKLSSSDEFYNRFVRPNNDKLDKYPTAFELVDLQKASSSLLLSKDLFIWTSIDELFQSEPSHEDITTVSAEEASSLDPPAPETNVASSDWSDADSGPEVPANQLAPAESPSSDSSHDKSSPPSSPEVAEENPFISQEPNVNDSELLFELTQKRKATQNYTQVPSSYSDDPISRNAVLAEFEEDGKLKVDYADPFYDRDQDLPKKPFIFANKKFTISIRNDKNVPDLEIKTVHGQVCISRSIQKALRNELNDHHFWQYAIPPPSKEEVMNTFLKEQAQRSQKTKHYSQNSTIVHSTNYKYSIDNHLNRRPDEFVTLTSLLIDIHVNTSGNLLPNPKTDAITMIAYRFTDANEMFPNVPKYGALVHNIDSKFDNMLSEVPNFRLEKLGSEIALVNRLLELTHYFDPDILTGYEINSGSWGYIIERVREHYDVNLLPELSRCRLKNNGKFGDRWGYTHTSNIRITGRHVLNVWRVLRSELTLTNYSFENCCFHVLHHTFPKYSNLSLTKFFKSPNFKLRSLFLEYYTTKLYLIESMINQRELITKNVEHSRLIGIDFNANFYRGSQFKVESILARIAKSQNFLLNSPSKKNVHDMRALEQIPLIMEPNSSFYKSPLIVLDFQSLYPSIMIAYNYCYSTLLCQLENFNPSRNNVGYLKHNDLDPGIIDFLKRNDCYNISPNGYVFVNSKLRKSTLAKMLEEILNARVNIRKFMRSFRKEDHPELYKVFNARQLALKLIANVTYGYTSATFSGRMPNSDIADAIVSTGREILSQSIDYIEASEFGAKVVYGDTDSLFVYLPGKTKAEAFDIGEALARRITDCFPDPVTLKFEKVYHPCVLLSKKRYVGYSYEFRDQATPKFDAKGIETIRRDGIPLQQQLVEKSLRILFDTKNLSMVKHHVLTQFQKIWLQKVLIKDFCFAKEVRYGTYKNEQYLPPGAVVAQKKVEYDPRSEPQYRERVPYVVYRDSSKHRLRDRCIAPEDFIASLSTSDPLELDSEYYIGKVLIPPLERIFNLIGVDVRGWYRELPKFRPHKRAKQADILNFEFVQSHECLNCGRASRDKICDDCSRDKMQVGARNKIRVKAVERSRLEFESVCGACIGRCGGPSSTLVHCVNQECTNYYRRIKTDGEMYQITHQSDALLNTIEW